MYARKLGTTTLTFDVSGRLWRNSLVMQDRETGTWWSQVTGRAIKGPSKGAQLQKLESIQTSWKQWVEAHPETSVLAKTEEVTSSHYQSYFENPERMGLFRARWLQGKMPGKKLVYGATVGPHAVAVTGEALSNGSVHVELGDVPVFVVRGADGGVRAFAIGGIEKPRLRTSERGDQEMIDTGGSIWNLDTGECRQGPCPVGRLEPIVVTSVFWFAWSGFYPNTLVID